jgi:hypothetical protein
MITEDAEIILEFYDESDVLLNEIKELENSLLLLEELEATLDEIDQELSIESTESNTEIINPTVGFINILIPFVDAAPQTIDDESRSEIAITKEKIKELKNRFVALQSSDSIDELTMKELKSELKSLIVQLKQTTNKVSQTKQSNLSNILENKTTNIENISDIKDDVIVQSDKWNSSEEQITVSIFDSKGNDKDISTEIEKLRDGKFNLKFSPDTNTKPGVYTVVTTVTVNGEKHTVKSEFAWGLVSLNSHKSTYYPGEIADFVIVVLDSEGHPIDNAELLMTITSPTNEISTKFTNNDIISGSETGLYETNYLTKNEGTYTVDITAKADGIDTNFSTTFDVASFVEYDIIRTAQSKIDPISNPNLFDVKIYIESHVDAETITITESVPVE